MSIRGYDDWKTTEPEYCKPINRCDKCGIDLYPYDIVWDFEDGYIYCDDCGLKKVEEDFRKELKNGEDL